MLWTEKYRPQSLIDLVGQSKFVSDARAWKNNMPNLLLYGPAGIGKTAAANALANFILEENKENNFFEINASDDRRLEVVRTKIKDIASSMKIGDIPHKIILLDEMDGMTTDAQNALKRLMERYSDNVRFIITSNHRHKINYPIQSRCAIYGFERLSEDQIYYVFERILTSENLTDKSDENELRRFIRTLDGDVRKGITQLQASIHSDTPLNIQIEKMNKPYSELFDCVLNNNFDMALSKMHDMLYKSVDVKTICISLHDEVIKRELPPAQKFKYLRVIGETEWRSKNMTPKLLASWMIGQMM